ncbi:MAG: biotin/lipoyl-containing protein [Gemmataceae bacterium]
MADDNETPRPFDVNTIRDLIRLMSRHDLSEVDLTWGDERIRLRRGSRVVHAPAPAAPAPAPVAPPPPAAHAAGSPPVSQPAAPSKKLIEIKSPTVGTFFAQREPGSPAFVTVGTRVTPATVVCLIEAMKVFNDVTADCSGVVREVCVTNKDFVEYNTVLFRVDPEG